MKSLNWLFILFVAIIVMLSLQACSIGLSTVAGGPGFYDNNILFVNETPQRIVIYANGYEKSTIPPYGKYTLTVSWGYSNWNANMNTNITLVRTRDGKATYRNFGFSSMYPQTQTWIINENSFSYSY